jgi:class 3 adenylate cyclase
VTKAGKSLPSNPFFHLNHDLQFARASSNIAEREDLSMAHLADTFRDPHSRMQRVVVAVDLANSTSMKAQHSEATWLNTYGWFFDLLGRTIEKGTIVKYLGDGAMAVFSEENAADAINWAIKVQENIADAQAQNVVPIFCECSIGIAFGDVVAFQTPDEYKDYIGTVVDRAFRLCSAANAKAIFVDTDSVTAALMMKVQSRIGISTAPKRKPAEYLSPLQSVTVRGFAQPVSYHEVFWGSDKYGVRAEFVTKLSQPETVSKPPQVALEPRASLRSTANWTKGVVTTLQDRFGFVTSNGEDFWFNSDHLFRRTSHPRLNDTVWFVPAAPGGTGAQGRQRRTSLELAALRINESV